MELALFLVYLFCQKSGQQYISIALLFQIFLFFLSCGLPYKLRHRTNKFLDLCEVNFRYAAFISNDSVFSALWPRNYDTEQINLYLRSISHDDNLLSCGLGLLRQEMEILYSWFIITW